MVLPEVEGAVALELALVVEEVGVHPEQRVLVATLLLVNSDANLRRARKLRDQELKLETLKRTTMWQRFA